ncbi:MAG: NAD(P)/FAD-dependent oxidoreductase [Candidatus Lokiarchaeota archaeon]|nr:NAD(P)/FAD-dependent oxidoreductase [Candidatus Lokiarchaeota archaeon]
MKLFKYVIIGNGVAGLHAAETIRREASTDSVIEIYTEEEYLTYSRPKLPQYIAEEFNQEELFLKTKTWFDEQNILISLGKKVTKIDDNNKKIYFSDGESTNYDRLLIATGSHSFLLPIKGTDHPRVKTLRSLDDAKILMTVIKDSKQVVVIGGGLLGLEIANAIRTKGVNVTIIEYFPRLLPLQLDLEGAEVLKKIIEDRGMRIILGATTESIEEKEKNLLTIKIKDGRATIADLIVISAGVRPNIDIAKQSDIEFNRGIIVNEYMETNKVDIWAAGDVTEMDNQCWGIIPAAFAQANVAAKNMINLDEKIPCGKIIPSNTLKVAGIDLTSIGTVYFEKLPDNVEEKRFIDIEKGIYKKVVIQDNQVIGAIWLGVKTNLFDIQKIVKKRINVEKFKDKLLKPDFNLKDFT